MTEAERIGQDAEKYSNFRASTDRFKKIKRNSYIAGATAEHERLQQQLKIEIEANEKVRRAHKEAQELIAKYTDIIHNLQRECIELRVANRKLTEAK